MPLVPGTESRRITYASCNGYRVTKNYVCRLYGVRSHEELRMPLVTGTVTKNYVCRLYLVRSHEELRMPLMPGTESRRITYASCTGYRVTNNYVCRLCRVQSHEESRNIKVGLQEVGVMDWIELAQDRHRWRHL
jgi:hypothetical protein